MTDPTPPLVTESDRPQQSPAGYAARVRYPGVWRPRGFTLIELMIVVAIVAILATIAYPSYIEQIRRGNRAAAQSEMMDIANRQQQFFLANRRYATSLADMNYAQSADVSARYTASITAGNILNDSCASVSGGTVVPSYVISFTAIGPQASDGALLLSSEGVKCPTAKW